MWFYIIYKVFILFIYFERSIYLFESERECMQGGGGQRVTESQANSPLNAEPAMELYLKT